MHEEEKRGATRQPVALPVELEGGQGITRDFSSSGIFFETDKAFSLGQAIEFTIMMDHLYTKMPILLKCQGKIVRIEEKEEMIGVAAAISCYTLGKVESEDGAAERHNSKQQSGKDLEVEVI